MLPPFPNRIKEHALIIIVSNKSDLKTNKPYDEIEAQPSLAVIKDLVTENLDGQVIQHLQAATDTIRNERSMNVVGTPIISVTIGTHDYHGSCDIGSSISVISFLFIKK